MLNVDNIVTQQQPDSSGKTIPLDVVHGTAIVSGAQGYSETINLAVASGVLNVTTATCGNKCPTCLGYCGFQVGSGDPFCTDEDFEDGFCPLDQTAKFDALALLQNGVWIDVSSMTSSVTWSSSAPTVASSQGSGRFLGNALGRYTGTATANLIEVNADCAGTGSPCPTDPWNGSGGGQTTPMVTIDSFSPNPIQAGMTATAHVTITPSAPVTMSIVSSGTGTATFGTSQNTSLVISESENLTITGGAVTTGGAADLSLNAAYNGAPVATPVSFSVTNGSCAATNTTHGGTAVIACPTAPVTISDAYTLAQYCPSCKFTCVPILYDSTFMPTAGGCDGSTSGILGAPNQAITLTDHGTFTSSDCSVHNLQIQTTVTDATGKVTNYVGGTHGLMCNGNGTPACN